MESRLLWPGFTFVPGPFSGQSDQSFKFRKAPSPSKQARTFLSCLSFGVGCELPCLHFKVASGF